MVWDVCLWIAALVLICFGFIELMRRLALWLVIPKGQRGLLILPLSSCADPEITIRTALWGLPGIDAESILAVDCSAPQDVSAKRLMTLDGAGRVKLCSITELCAELASELEKQ